MKKTKKKLKVKQEQAEKFEEDQELKVKRNRVFTLGLTKTELVHVRDMLSILYPSESKRTISQTLADGESRLFEESNLWKKVASLCEEADLPVGDEAPDYAIVPIGHAPMGVFMLSDEESEMLSKQSKGFLRKEDDVENSDKEE